MGNPFSKEEEESSEQLNHVSKHEFKKSVQEEMTRASKAIEGKFDDFMESKDRKIQFLTQKVRELEKERDSNYTVIKKYYTDKHSELQRQHEYQIQEILKHAATSENALCLEKDSTIHHYKQQYEYAQEEIQRLKQLTDPTREMRMRNDCIRAGDIVHREVALEFKQVYKERWFLQKLKITTQLERARFLTQIFEHAYKCCSKEIMSKAIEELQLLHDAPKRSYTEKEREEPDIWYPWKGRQDAYSCLISVANAEHKLKPLPEHVVNQVMEAKIIKDNVTNQEADVKEVVKRITEISWKMVLLTPPITFDNLPTYSEETHEKSFAHGATDKLLLEGKCIAEPMRPVLFYGPLGTVGEKGEVRIVPLKEASRASNNIEITNTENSKVNPCIPDKDGQGITKKSVGNVSDANLDGVD